MHLSPEVTMAHDADKIAVIGAGFAGLAAATRLARSGYDVTVFEARQRPGGRVWSQTLQTATGENVIERGAEFILDGYEAMRTLSEGYGLQWADTGMSYYVRDLYETPHITTQDVAQAGQQAASLVSSLPAHVTVADVFEQLDISTELRHALQARVEISAAAPIHEVAAKALYDVASFEPQPSYRLEGGNQGLALAMAHELGDRVRYGHAVNAVSIDGERVVIAIGEGRQVFDKAVIAVPCGVLRDGTLLSVDMSGEKSAALERLVQGHAGKIHISLTETVATSAVMSVNNRFWTWTATNSAGTVPAMLNGFIGSLPAMQSLQVTETAQPLKDAVVSMRNDLPIEADATVVATEWATDPYAQGAYTAASPIAHDHDWKLLERPEQNIFYAGEYAEPEYTGLMEGALRSGLRAAYRIETDRADVGSHDFAHASAR